MSFTLKNGAACRTFGMSEVCSSIAAPKSVLLFVPFPTSNANGHAIAKPIARTMRRSDVGDIT